MIVSKSFHMFSDNYLFDTKRLIPVRLSDELLKSFKIIDTDENLYSSFELDRYKHLEHFNEILEFAEGNVLLHKDKFQVYNSFKELNISLIPILACNLSCKYCYSNNKSKIQYISEEMVKTAFEFFCNNYDFSFCRIDFVSGGEPLFDQNYLKKIILDIRKILDEYNKDYLFWLCTNGVLLNSEITKFLNDNNVNIGISLDGEKEINDINRVDIYGNGTYDKVYKNVKDILNNPKLSRNFKNLWNSSVITADTNSIVSVMKNSFDIGFENLQMKTVWSNDSRIKPSLEKIIKLYSNLKEYMLELVMNNNIKEFLTICNENDSFGKILLRLIIQSGVTRRCNAGVNKFSLSPEGNLYPCDSFLNNDAFCVGNIFNGFNSNYDKFYSIRTDKIDKCSKCWACYVCGGDCFYNSFINNNDILDPDIDTCKINKKIIELTVNLIISSYERNPIFMEKIYNILSRRTELLDVKR